MKAGRGGGVALIHHETGERVTYAELAERSDRAAAALTALGVRVGDRIALRGPNRPDLVVAALAAWKAGAVAVPTPAQARAAELAYLLTDTRPVALLTSTDADVVGQVPAALAGMRGRVPLVLTLGAPTPESEATGYGGWERTVVGTPGPVPGAARLARVGGDHVAVVWHTGGTTGQPKGCYHTLPLPPRRPRPRARARHAPRGGLGGGGADGPRAGLPPSTVFTLLHGATVVLVDGFTDPASVLAAITDHQVTTFTAITASWARLLAHLDEHGDDGATASLRRGFAMWQSASGTAVYDAWLERGVELLNNFGSTSFATWVLVPHGPGPVPRASLGRAAPGYEVAAIEPEGSRPVPVAAGTPGRMAVRGPSRLTYWRRPELQARDVVDGWTLVDDLIQLDDEALVSYLGRTDFLISTAGYKVAPVEVETVLAQHPAVREVAVVGLPDPTRQQVVAAFVAVHDGYSAGDALRRELQDLVKRELSPYKYPRRVEFVAALPRDHVGKVQPRLLVGSAS